jgi:S-adenosylmethionine decarboxylase
MTRAALQADGVTPRGDRAARHFGVHLTLDGYGGSPERLGDPACVRFWLEDVPVLLGMTKLAPPVLVEVDKLSDKDPGGVTGIVLIAESHISVHTFPLRGFVSADVYTCQNQLDVERLLELLRTTFELDDIEHNLIIRGTRYPQHDIYPAAGEAAVAAARAPLLEEVGR